MNTEGKSPNVVAAKGYQPQAIMADRSKTITIIGAGNALGSNMPPYFVFPGQRMVPELMQGKSLGADGTMTPTGWSNSEVFSQYMKNHFLKYVQGRGTTDPLLVLYDGHKSYISLDLVDWAKKNNIVLFVLPPHCSHILQPMDIGCFGPLQLKYSQECLTFNRFNLRTVTRYDVCELACRAYSAALSPANLQSAFAKAGIYPLRSSEQMVETLKTKTAPSTLYKSKEPTVTETTVTETANVFNKSELTESSSSFFETRGCKVGKTIEKKKRRNISSVVGGKAVTEEKTLNKMKEFINEKPVKKSIKGKSGERITCKSKNVKSSVVKSAVMESPKPGPSHTTHQQELEMSLSSSEEETESQMKEESKCCVCKRFYVKSPNVYKVSLVNWAQCDSCGHWVHLTYCTEVRVVRRDTPFKCPCCLLLFSLLLLLEIIRCSGQVTT